MPRKKDMPDDDGQLFIGMPPSTYALNSDVAIVVERLIAYHSESLGHLANFKLACLRRSSTRTNEHFSVDKAGGSWVCGDRERGKDLRFDAGVWFQASWWDRFSPEQRQAWAFHQLCHLQMNPHGRLVRVGHDTEAFASEARIFGAWEDQLRLFAQGLDENEGGHAGERD